MIDVRQETDRIPGRPLGYIAAGVVASILLAAVVVIVIEALAPYTTRGLQTKMPGGIPRDVGHVEAFLYQVPTDAERQKAEALVRLSTWGWTDRAARRIHVPLTVATRLYLEELAGEAKGAAEKPSEKPKDKPTEKPATGAGGKP